MNYMTLALSEAEKSGIDIPVGCVIVKNGEIISAAHNEKEKENNSLFHAEILAISKAHKKLNSKMLDNCEMYVTLEPCPMCMWAILSARIKKLYFGAYDFKYGAAGSVFDFKKIYGSKIDIIGGIMEQDSETLIKEYFSRMRDETKTR